MMKNIKRFSAIAFIGIFVLIFNSCEDTSEKFTISSNPNTPILEALNFTRLELDANNTNNPAISLNWVESDYGQQAAVNYLVQFSSDEAFTEPTTASTVTGLSTVTLSVSEVNSAAGGAGLNPFEWKNVYIRVASTLGTKNSEMIVSNTISLEVYPYYNYAFDDYYLVGNATAPDWNNNNNNPALYRDGSDSNVFYYTGYFNTGEFKVLETKGLWQPQWGTNDASSIEVNPGGGTDPGTFPNNNNAISTAGFYTFTINFATKTFDFQPFDATGITSPTTLTLQGSSTADVAMTPLAFDGHIWYANSVRLTPGEVEFVTNSGARWGSDSAFSGMATDGGGAIPVIVEYDYDVWFNDLTGRYILIPLNL